MRLSSLVNRIGGETAAAWDLHTEAQRAKSEGRDVIVLSIGDPDFDTPEPIRARAAQAMNAGDTHYAAIEGRPHLRQAIADHQMRIAGGHVKPEQVCVYSGAQNALFAASFCLVEHGDEVIVPEPCYVTYEATVKAPGADWVLAPQPGETDFRPDPDAIGRAVTERTRAIFIITPNNPTGVVMTRDELSAIAAIAKRHDLWVVSDEVYAALTFEAEHVSIATLPGMAERTVTVSSLSKSHAMTGWRLGWAIGPEALMGHMAKLSLCMLYGMPGFIQEAATTALNDCRDDTARIRDAFRRRRDLVSDRLSAVPGLHVVTPDAGMFVMVDVRGTGLDAAPFCRALFDETGVCVLNAAPFGPSSEGHVRISFASSDAELTEACTRIEGFIRRRTRAA
jgi:arginine:pyruvate transaminase